VRRTIPVNGRISLPEAEASRRCGQIIPVEFPALMQAWKLGRLLADGLQPSCSRDAEQNSAQRVAHRTKISRRGFPPVVVNIGPVRPNRGGSHRAPYGFDKVALRLTKSAIYMRAACDSNLTSAPHASWRQESQHRFRRADMGQAIRRRTLRAVLQSGPVVLRRIAPLRRRKRLPGRIRR